MILNLSGQELISYGSILDDLIPERRKQDEEECEERVGKGWSEES